MSKTLCYAMLKKLGFPVLVACIAAGMASSLSMHGGPMLRAAAELSLGSLGLAILLNIVHRAINATGWGIILRSLGEPIRIVPAARVWLASEACRWLPGSLWAFGSRAVLATRRGLGGTVVGTSIALELVVTVTAWVLVAAIGCRSLKVPEGWTIHDPTSATIWAAGATILLLIVGFGASRSSRIRAKLTGLARRLRELRTTVIDGPTLLMSVLFFMAMSIFNGATLYVIVHSTPEGASCPIWAVIAANAVAWLVGFFALFAPGGLIVREACLVSLLTPWIPPSLAITLALAWRLTQIVAELGCFLVVAATGLPLELKIKEIAPEIEHCLSNHGFHE